MGEEEVEEEGKGEGEGQEREGSKSSRIGRQPISCSDRTILQHTFPLTRSCKIKTLAPSVPESNKKRCSNATALHDTKKNTTQAADKTRADALVKVCNEIVELGHHFGCFALVAGHTWVRRVSRDEGGAGCGV